MPATTRRPLPTLLTKMMMTFSTSTVAVPHGLIVMTERLEISLVDSNRLKKLRKNGGEDIVTGKEYVKRLRTRFEKIYPVPLWAQDKVADIASEDEDEDMESDDDAPISSDPLAKLLQSTSRYISNDKTKLLPAGVIDIDRLKDANQAARSIGAVQSLQFHPTHPLLLTSGYDNNSQIVSH